MTGHLRIAIALVVISAACRGTVAAPTPLPLSTTPAIESIKIGTVETMPGALPPLAQEKGYFREAGLDARVEIIPSGQNALALVANSQLDVAVAGLFAATFNGIESGLDVKVVGSLGRFPSKAQAPTLMIRKDLIDAGLVKTLADLRGRRVAGFGGRGGTGAYLVSLALRDAGLTVDDLELVNLAFPDTLAAFNSAAVDAAYLPEPFATQATRAGIAEGFGVGVPSSFYTVAVLFSGAFMREQPQAARSTMQALVRAARDLRGDGYRRPENLALLTAHTHLPPEAFASLGSFDLDADLSPDADTLRDMEQVYMQLGVLNYHEPIPLERLMDTSFAAQAAASLGRP